VQWAIVFYPFVSLLLNAKLCATLPQAVLYFYTILNSLRVLVVTLIPYDRHVVHIPVEQDHM